MTTSLDGGPEDRQRPRLRCDERQLEVSDVHAVGPLRGHQRELVERQRPDRADRLDEGESAGVAPLDVLHDPVVDGVRVGVAEASRRARRHRPAWHRPRSAARRTRRACPRRCARPGRRGRPTPACPGSTRRRSRARSGAAGSAVAARRRTARAPPLGGTPAPRWGRSARCRPSPLPVAVAEADPRPRRCRRHRSLPENRSCRDRTARRAPLPSGRSHTLDCG